MPLFRKSDTPDPTTPVVPDDGQVPAGKGHPTPKRREAEARNKRPLVPDDRKVAAKQARAKERAVRDREYQALKDGDERYFPPRDRGPVRKFVRDYVDSRFLLGEFFLPVAIVFLLITAVAQQNVTFAAIAIAVLYLYVLVTIVQLAFLGRSIKKAVAAKFGEDGLQRGITMYGVLRSVQIRRSRLPKPTVKRGQKIS